MLGLVQRGREYGGPEMRRSQPEYCPEGHRYNEEALYVDAFGRWNCRVCWRINAENRESFRRFRRLELQDRRLWEAACARAVTDGGPVPLA